MARISVVRAGRYVVERACRDFVSWITHEPSAAAYVTVRSSDRAVLDAKNASSPITVASIVKLRTAEVVRQSIGNLQEHIVIEQDDFPGGSNAGLRPGDIVTVEDALSAMLLRSGNEAACALARVVGGILSPGATSEEALHRFAKEMGAGYGNSWGRGLLTAVEVANLALDVANDPTLVALLSASNRTISIVGRNSRELQIENRVNRWRSILPGFIFAKTGTGSWKASVVVVWRHGTDTYASAILSTSATRYRDAGILIRRQIRAPN